MKSKTTKSSSVSPNGVGSDIRTRRAVRAEVDESASNKSVNQVAGNGRRTRATDDPDTVSSPSSSTGVTAAASVDKRSVVRYDESLPGPRAMRQQNRLKALRLLNRFRQLRTLDLAVGLFPDRPFKAALSAAQRITKSLVADRMLLRYRSLSGQSYYALGEAGARWLRQNGNESDADASASASRACEKVNPEHDLWGAFSVLACEARRLTALTEKELKARLIEGNDLGRSRSALVVAPDRETTKGLLPDAIACDKERVIWFEIDRSERGAGRMADLVALVQSCGAQVSLGGNQRMPLRHIVVLCKTERIYRRHLAHVTGVNPSTGLPRLRTLGGQPALKQLAPGVFDVHRDVERRLSDGRVELRREVVGRLHMQLLPVWLSSFSYRLGSRHDGWTLDGYLPFRNLPDGWPAAAAAKSDRD